MNNKSPLVHLLLFFGIFMLLWFFVTIIAQLSLMNYFHVEKVEEISSLLSRASSNIDHLVLILGIFVSSQLVLILCLLITKKLVFKEYLFAQNNKMPIWYAAILVAILIYIVVFPGFNYLELINEKIEPPTEIKASINAMEESSLQLYNYVLSFNYGLNIIWILIVMSILPAVVEELFFRGTLFPIFSGLTKNGHLGVLFTSLFFSLVHFQWNNFLAIFCAGIILGYLYYFTGSIWVPIIFHVLNNGIFVLYDYYQKSKGNINYQSTFQVSHLLGIFSILSVVLILFFLYKKPAKPIEIPYEA